MASGDVETAKQSTSSSNPDVDPTVSTLMRGLQNQYGKGVGVYNNSLYPGAGDTTRQGWNATLAAARNPIYSGSINNTMSEFGDIASGKRFGMNDPGYETLRQNVIDDTQSNINSQFTNSGRFGGGSHVSSLGEGIGNAVAGLDYSNFQNDQQRQMQAAGMLPGLFQGSLAPGATIGAVGAGQDADALATRQGANDLFRRQNDAGWQALERASGILHGTAASAGTDTTKSVPWWAAAGGVGAGLLGGLF